MIIFSHWFWSALSFIFAALWLWTLFRQRREKKKKLAQIATDQICIDAEDALKAAYRLHEKKKDWGSKDLSLSWG